MKKNFPMIIVVTLLMASRLNAGASEEGKIFARNWLSMNCADATTSQSETQNFVKYKDELKAYFISAIQRGLELDGMREEENALGQIYDQNIKMLNENKPAWVTPEYENKIRSVSREAFIANGKEVAAKNYKAQALRGLELINSLPQ